MRALFYHIAIGTGAAVAFLAALLALNTGELRHLDGLGLSILCGLIAMFFLSTQLILSRLSQEDDGRIRINSRD